MNNKLMTHIHRIVEELQAICVLIAETQGNNSKPANPPPQNKSQNNPKPQGTNTPRGPTEKQIKRLFALMHKGNWNNDQLHEFIFKAWKLDSVKVLDSKKYEFLCEKMPIMSFETAMKKLGSR